MPSALRHVLLAVLAMTLSVSQVACSPWPDAAVGLASSPAEAVTPPLVGTPEATLGPSSALADAAEVYARLAPAMAFIETPLGTGSGVLVAGGYVVTNAHVVWPYEHVRVVFPDGSEHAQVAVHRMDMLVDLAVLGPIDAAGPPPLLQDGEHLPVGEDVYVIGYPGEVERFPQPSISRGVLSRYREWPAGGITYLQTDATVAGGQSGGALASPDGVVVGMSGFSFAGQFGLAASVGDLVARIEQLIAGEQASALGDRRLPFEGGASRHQGALSNLWDVRAFVLNAAEATTVRLEADGDTDLFVGVVDAFGETLVLIDEDYQGYEEGSATLPGPGIYFVIVGHMAEATGHFLLRSSHPLQAYHDADDGQRLRPGDAVIGCLDHPWDADYYFIDLREGQSVEVVVDSVMIDPYLTIDYVGATEDQVASDDDSAVGLFGLSAGLIYTAGHTGEYMLVVEDAEQREAGGYILSVTER